MSIYKKHTQPFISLLLLIGVVFLMHLIATPLSNIQNQSAITSTTSSGDVSKTHLPFQRAYESFFVADFTGIEILTNVEVNYIINQNIRDFQRILNRAFQPLVLPTIYLGILIYYILYLYRKLDQKKSVLSTSNGGHAPPRKSVLNN
jgi:uncharacterized membrane protein AbrB (regulator of aidB expression)